MDKSSFASREEKARRYSRIKYTLYVCESGLFLVFCLFWVLSPFAGRIANILAAMAGPSSVYVTGSLFFLFLSLIWVYVSFPENFYRSFLLEHQFGLSSEPVQRWFCDQLKGWIVSSIIGVSCLCAFYFAYSKFPDKWWLLTAIAWTVFSAILGSLAPLVIIPLFFKQTRLPDGTLRSRLERLAENMGIRILDIYSINLSTRTHKANAALAGLGSTRRVLISDTLLNNYSPEEIEVITAHEFAHHRLNHILKTVFLQGALAMIFCLAVYRLHPVIFSSGVLALDSPEAVAVLWLYLAVFGAACGPALNFISRKFEADSDAVAIRQTGMHQAFISSMEKLADQNLSDTDPPALVKWLFFDHPPIKERICAAGRIQRE
ncbi:MAG: M48 family metallopeptidase [Candidatus Omnitrophica bacterium]|jgi:STE24 endopeptidase|nr:M48 family metallopeptidase [Candidatus Omnitrophota bacterium]